MSDYVGTRFGRLQVQSVTWEVMANGKRTRAAICLCDCGNNTKPIRLSRLRAGVTSSCGCITRENAAALAATRPRTTHGMCQHELYATWTGMIQRCYDLGSNRYKDYGGRGIEVCPEWRDDPRAFIEWVKANLGPRPKGHTLDRIENQRGYEPGNVQWATVTNQNRNTRRNVLDRVKATEIRRLWDSTKHLKQSDPERWTYKRLAEKFEASIPVIGQTVRGELWADV